MGIDHVKWRVLVKLFRLPYGFSRPPGPQPSLVTDCTDKRGERVFLQGRRYSHDCRSHAVPHLRSIDMLIRLRMNNDRALRSTFRECINEFGGAKSLGILFGREIRANTENTWSIMIPRNVTCIHLCRT